VVTHELNPDYWIGRLSAAIAQSLNDDPDVARADLRRELDRLMKSPASTDELVQQLKGMMK
jgi:hypothetical protein